MNEERFSVLPYNVVWDNQLGEVVCRCILEGMGDAENVCQRLNEQQATIERLERKLKKYAKIGEEQLDQIIELQDKYRILEFNHSRLEKRNKAQYEKIGEQQATIRRLQDLCGESDGENAKLRIENKKLKAKLKEKEEDEQLYAKEILELRETNKQWSEFKELGGDY